MKLRCETLNIKWTVYFSSTVLPTFLTLTRFNFIHQKTIHHNEKTNNGYDSYNNWNEAEVFLNDVTMK